MVEAIRSLHCRCFRFLEVFCDHGWLTWGSPWRRSFAYLA